MATAANADSAATAGNGANAARAASPAPDSTVEAELSIAWASVDRLVDGFMRQLPSIVLAILVFALFWLAGRTLGSLVRRVTAGRLHVNVALALSRLLQWFVLGLGLLVALAIAAPSVKPSDILSVLGIGSVAIGFAFKDVLQNFLAGMLILIRQPFRVGDEIVFKSFEGVVEDIETRSTRLRTYDGRRVVVPNGEIYTNSFIVNTAYDSRRSEFDVGIGYGDDIGRAIEAILAAVRGVSGVHAKPAPDVIPVELAGSSVNLRVRWWTDARWADVVGVRGRVIAAVREALRAAQIDVPFPTRVVLFHDQTDAHDGDRRHQREGWPAGDDPPAPRNLPAAVEALAPREGAARGRDAAWANR